MGVDVPVIFDYKQIVHLAILTVELLMEQRDVFTAHNMVLQVQHLAGVDIQSANHSPLLIIARVMFCHRGSLAIRPPIRAGTRPVMITHAIHENRDIMLWVDGHDF